MKRSEKLGVWFILGLLALETLRHFVHGSPGRAGSGSVKGLTQPLGMVPHAAVPRRAGG